MGGKADQFVRADQLADFGHRKVILSHMDAVGINQSGKAGIIVDQKKDTGLTGQVADDAAFLKHCCKTGVWSFFPVLNDADAAFDHLANHLNVCASGREFFRGDAVNALRKGWFTLLFFHRIPSVEECIGS